MVKHPRPLLEISLSDFRRLATLNMITYLHRLSALETESLLCNVSSFPDIPCIF